jgi:hypothetical protein
VVNKFYVPKALSTLLEMFPSLVGHPAIIMAKFVDPFNINPSYKYFEIYRGVSEYEIAIMKNAKNRSARVRAYEVVELETDNNVYQQQMNHVRLQEKANKDMADRFLKTLENQKLSELQMNNDGVNTGVVNNRDLTTPANQRMESGKMFYDANNVGYVGQSNGPQWQQMANDHLVIQRMFEGPQQHFARLGTSTLNYTFDTFLNIVMSDPSGIRG